MDFRFGDLFGAPYRGGAVVFDDATLLSPVGNRIQAIDLRGDRCRTLPLETLFPVRLVCLSPCGNLLLLFDTEGRLTVVHKKRETVLHRLKFKDPVRCAKFSPNGQLLAVACGRRLQLWRRPELQRVSPMSLYRSYNAVAEDITCLDWTSDGFGVAAGGEDMTTRIYTIDPVRDYKPGILGGHRGVMVGVFFTSEEMQMKSQTAMDERDRPIHFITVGAAGKICEWSYDRSDVIDRDTAQRKRRREDETAVIEDDATGEQATSVDYIDVRPRRVEDKAMREDWSFHRGRWLRCRFLSLELGKTTVTDVDFHRGNGLMVMALSSGVFELLQFPGGHRLQRLSVSSASLTTVKLSSRADWIAIGCAGLGQLLVWDWRSETQVLKQQGHAVEVNAVAFSPDGSWLLTGGDDSKVKLYSMATGFCLATFAEHLMPITAVAFLPNGNAAITASIDGTLRAFDCIRHRPFRKFVSPESMQFSCLAVDPHGEIVAAGSRDAFRICVWSIKTAKLLDVLAGHEGPISALAFHPVRPMLGSSSWDGSIKLWDVFTSKGNVESFLNGRDVTTFTFRPDGKQLAAATTDGGIHLWDTVEGIETGMIDGRRDVARGRFVTDRRIATPFSTEAMFTSLVYAADGGRLFAAGKSKYICLYDVENSVLLQKIVTSRNKALDGVLDVLNSRHLTEAGVDELIDMDDDGDGDRDLDLPGTVTSKRQIVQTRSLALSPTGQCFAAATTEGVLVFDLDRPHLFDPIDLEEDVTPQASIDFLNAGQYAKALIVALRLNEDTLMRRCLLSTPVETVSSVTRQIPIGYATTMVDVLCEAMKTCPDLELLLHWTRSCCVAFGSKQSETRSGTTQWTKLHQVLRRLQIEIGSLVDGNLYLMDYLRAASQTRQDRNDP